MDDPFLVHRLSFDGPRTHAIVIGIGDYPHLVGGTAEPTADGEGMKQLTSPPVSARALAAWLIRKLHNPGKPLGTVALLLSETGTGEFVNPVTGDAYSPAPATIANLTTAIKQWKDRADEHCDNMLVFYFCGHGISAGTEMAILASDFGADPDSSLDGAIDVRKLILGLNQCRASEQVFFIDACRGSSDQLIQAEFSGRVVIQPRPRKADLPTLRSATFYATLKGAGAYGIPGRPTVYTDSLIDALDQLAATKSEGDWRVSTNRLSEALDHLMARHRTQYPGLAQVPESNDRSNLYLHYLDSPPEALVYVASADPNELHAAQITCVSESGVTTSLPKPEPGVVEMECRLPSGMYDFSATLQHKTSRVRAYVQPVFQRVHLK